MRAAVLHFGFRVLGAELAVTGAFPTNKGSIRVSEKIGYLPNGVRRDRVRGRPVDSVLFRLPRELWESSSTVPVEVEGFEGCERLFGLGRGTRGGWSRVSVAAVWDNVGVALPLWPDPTSSTRSTSTSPRRRLRSSRRSRPSRRRSRGTAASTAAAGRKSAYSTTLFEEARCSVARFVGCDDADDVVFVRNTTEAANLLAVALPPGTRVLCSSFEHHANLLPWRQHRVTHLPFTTTAAAFLAAAADALEEAERAGDPFSLVAITGASNVTGEVPPVAEVARLAHARGALVFVDAAQLAPHRRIDLHELGADFLAFSGHKVYAPFGTGVLVSPADGLAERIAAAPRRRRRAARHARRCRLGRDAAAVRGRDAEPARGRRARGGLRRARVVRHGCRRRARAAARERALGRARRDRRRATAPPVDGCARSRRCRRVHRRRAGRRTSSGRIWPTAGSPSEPARSAPIRSSPTCSASSAADTARLLHEAECGEDVTIPGAVRASIGLGTTRADIDAFLAAIAEAEALTPA